MLSISTHCKQSRPGSNVVAMKNLFHFGLHSAPRIHFEPVLYLKTWRLAGKFIRPVGSKHESFDRNKLKRSVLVIYPA